MRYQVGSREMKNYQIFPSEKVGSKLLGFGRNISIVVVQNLQLFSNSATIFLLCMLFPVMPVSVISTSCNMNLIL